MSSVEYFRERLTIYNQIQCSDTLFRVSKERFIENLGFYSVSHDEAYRAVLIALENV